MQLPCEVGSHSGDPLEYYSPGSTEPALPMRCMHIGEVVDLKRSERRSKGMLLQACTWPQVLNSTSSPVCATRAVPYVSFISNAHLGAIFHPGLFTHIVVLALCIHTHQHFRLTLPLQVRRLLYTLQHRQPTIIFPRLRSFDYELRSSYNLLFSLFDRAAHAYDSYDDRQVAWMRYVSNICEGRPDHFVVVAWTPDYRGRSRGRPVIDCERCVSCEFMWG
jgi:hypothetical protein